MTTKTMTPTTMTPTQFRVAIDHLGLSQVKAAHFLGFAPRTARRVVAGAAELPASAAKLLRVMIAHGLTPAEVDALFEKKPAAAGTKRAKASAATA